MIRKYQATLQSDGETRTDYVLSDKPFAEVEAEIKENVAFLNMLFETDVTVDVTDAGEATDVEILAARQDVASLN